MTLKDSILTLLVAAAAATVSAAIITERNNLLTYPPNYATFRGTSAAPGIDSCWIPYGTYSGGTGTVEYLRVTSNLIGVVASAFDGLRERVALPFSSGSEVLDDPYKLLLIPSSDGSYLESDNGEFLASATNNTLRLLDLLNADYMVFCYQSGSDYSYPTASVWLEESLAHENTSYSFAFHDGQAARFGSRNLDALVLDSGKSIDPPIGTAWATDLPFKSAESNEWVYVWPTYSALTNDIHFFDASTNACRYYRQHLSGYFMPITTYGWFYPNHLQNVWGNDVFGELGSGTGLDLENALNSMPIRFNMEDALSVDTGWRYDYPPVETNSFWDVSGPLGNWRLNLVDPGHVNMMAWANDFDPDAGGYYVEIDYDIGYSYEFRIFTLPEWEVIVTEYLGPGDRDDVYFGDYHAQRTRLIANQDDYAHWRNMTRRLDWKRLGIICQLERQMEQTYQPRDEEDYLPFLMKSGLRDRVYTGSIVVPTIDAGGGPVATTNFNTLGVAYSLSTQIVEVATTNMGWCYPTARLADVHEVGRLDAFSTDYVPVYASFSQFEDLFINVSEAAALSAGLTNGVLSLVFSGPFDASSTLTDFEWRWNLDDAYFEPEDLSPGESVPFTASGIEYFNAAATFPSNVLCNLVMSVGKRSRTLQTDGSDFSTVVTNLLAQPSTNTWAQHWVASQDRPSLEVMLDARGPDFVSYAASESNDPMTWDDIKWAASNNTRRAFRMSPVSAPQGSLSASNYNRWEQLSALDAEVKARFQTLSGFNMDTAAQDLTNFTAGEEQSLKNQLAAQNIQLTMSLSPAQSETDLSLYAIGYVRIDGNGQSSNMTLQGLLWRWYDTSGEVHYVDVEPSGSDYLLGGYSFALTSVNITNQVHSVDPVRVDGHQDQMIKTLWRFKNLRDPNL